MSEENLRELYLKFLEDNNYTEEIVPYERFKESIEEIMNANKYNNTTDTSTNEDDKNYETNTDENTNSNDDILKTRYRFFKNEKDGKYYTIKHTFNRFNIPFDENQEGIRINGFLCYPIDENYINQIINNANNNFSPYITTTEEVSVDVNEDEDENEDSFYPPTVVNPNQEEDNNSQKNKVNEEGNKDNGDDSHKPVEYPPTVIDQDEKDKDDDSHKPVEYPPTIKQDTPETPHVKPHVEQILAKLTNGLKIQKNDGKLYETSNIKVSNIFKAETDTGNRWYKLAGIVKGTLNTIGAFVAKQIASIRLSEQSKKNMAEIDARLHGKSEDTTKNLTDEELEVLWEEYKGSRLLEDNNGNTINPLIGKRLREYGLEKVAKLNNEIKQNYALIYSTLKQIDSLETKIKNETDPTTKKAYQNQIKVLYSQAGNAVKNILEKRKEADNILDSGVHGILEDFKATASGMNYVGYRFREKFDFNNELQDKLGKTGQNINTALAYGDDENLVKSFMEHEKIYFDNTKIEHGFWHGGDYSAGEKYYTPLAQEFDYRDDPLLTNVFTTVAIAGVITNLVGTAVNQYKIAKIINQKNNEIINANQANQATAQDIRNIGTTMTGRTGTIKKGMEAQTHQDILNITGTEEREMLDASDWGFDHIYHVKDAQAHQNWSLLNQNYTNRINAIASKYATRAYSQQKAVEEISKVANDAQDSLNQVINQGIAECQKYAAAHPEHDLTAVIDSMKYIQRNPNAIIDMNQAVTNNLSLAQQLTYINAQTVKEITKLPSNWLWTIIGAATSAALANRVANSAKSQNYHRGYGNEITAMMDEYYNGQEEENTETHAKAA